MSSEMAFKKACVEDVNIKVEPAATQLLDDGTQPFAVEGDEFSMRETLVVGIEAAKDDSEADKQVVENETQGPLKTSSCSSKMVGVEQQLINAVEIKPVLKKIRMASASSQEKLSHIEARVMNGRIEIHEAIRQAKMAVDMYDDSLSDLGWYSAIWHRELVKFEVAERARLRASLGMSLIDVADIATILKKKVHMIIIGVLTQSFKELEHYDQMPDGEDKDYFNIEMTRMRKNTKYLVDIVVPYGLQLSLLKNLPLTSKAFMTRYLELAHDCQLMENYVVQPYNAEFNVASLVEWDDESQQYKLKRTAPPAEVIEPPLKKNRIVV